MGTSDRVPRIAAYCIICRDVQPLRLKRAGRDDTGVRFTGTCESCGVRWIISPKDFLSLSSAAGASVRELMAETNPRLPLAVAERVIHDKRAAAGMLEPPERAWAMREPFGALTYLAIRGEWFIAGAMTSLAAGVVVMMATIGVFDPEGRSRLLSEGREAPLVKVGLILVPAAIMLAVFARMTFVRCRRRVLAELVPRLARSLRPLRPTLEELEKTFEWLRTSGHPVARNVTAHEVHEAVRGEVDRSLTNADEMDILGLAREMYARLAESPHELEDFDEPEEGPPPDSDAR